MNADPWVQALNRAYPADRASQGEWSRRRRRNRPCATPVRSRCWDRASSGFWAYPRYRPEKRGRFCAGDRFRSRSSNRLPLATPAPRPLHFNWRPAAATTEIGNRRNRKTDAQDPPRGQIMARSRRGNKKLADWFQRRVRSGPGRKFLLFAVFAAALRRVAKRGRNLNRTRIEQESKRTCRLVRISRRTFPS